VSDPIPVKITRYRCPFCTRSASRPARAREHIARCWYNPQARGCKTCRNYSRPYDGEEFGGGGEEFCDAGISLTGRPACGLCHGYGQVFGEELGASECPECGGDAAEIKPGPIVHCSEWQADDR
jgi:hypothetical protein